MLDAIKDFLIPKFVCYARSITNITSVYPPKFLPPMSGQKIPPNLARKWSLFMALILYSILTVSFTFSKCVYFSYFRCPLTIFRVQRKQQDFSRSSNVHSFIGINVPEFSIPFNLKGYYLTKNICSKNYEFLQEQICQIINISSFECLPFLTKVVFYPFKILLNMKYGSKYIFLFLILRM